MTKLFVPSSKARIQAEHLVNLLGLKTGVNLTEQLDALKFIKNGIIGNKTKKEIYLELNIMPRLVELLSAEIHPSYCSVKTQAAIVLGSLAHGSPSIVDTLPNNKTLLCLLSCIDVDKHKLDLVEAASRALKSILQHPNVDSSSLYNYKHLHNLLKLLNTRFNLDYPNRNIPTLYTAELGASILARSCDENQRQLMLVNEGLVPWLMKMLDSESIKAQEAALSALSAVVKDNEDAGKWVVEYNELGRTPPLQKLFELARSMNPGLQLAAATCLTNLTRSKAIPSHFEEVMVIVLPTLIRLLDATGPAQVEAPLILAYLVAEDEAMQKAACDADAIIRLASIIANLSSSNPTNSLDYQSHDKEKFEENALLALASISTLKEECREKVIEARTLPHIVKAMAHPKVGIRAAACQCTRSLSRSVKNLRSSLVDAGVTEPLFKLLDDESPKVQISALATLCNIVLEFSATKKHIIDNGGITKLVQLVDSYNEALRLNAVWALKNLLFGAEPNVKTKVMDHLTYDRLTSLINNDVSTIQEQALGLLRNLSCGKDTMVKDIFEGIGQGRLIKMLEDKLRTHHEQIVIQTLYTIVNICTGQSSHKSSVMDCNGILSFVQKYMDHKLPSIRVAAVWCVINLSWIENNHPESDCLHRIKRLRNYGLEKTLRKLLEDTNLDVRDRAKTALSHFRAEQHASKHPGSRATSRYPVIYQSDDEFEDEASNQHSNTTSEASFETNINAL